MVYPLAVRGGTEAALQFASSNLPAESRATTNPSSDSLPLSVKPAPWPAGVPMFSGSRPAVLVTDRVEVVEAPPSDKPQEVPAAPVGINGRLDAPGQQDRYRLAVTPGSQLKFDVLARRAVRRSTACSRFRTSKVPNWPATTIAPARATRASTSRCPTT